MSHPLPSWLRVFLTLVLAFTSAIPTAAAEGPVVRDQVSPFAALADASLPSDQEPEPATLTLDLRVDPALAEPGEQITYTVSIANPGESAVLDVSLSDTLPAGLTYIPDDVTDLECDQARGALALRIKELLPGEARKVTFRTEVGELQPGAIITNNMTLSWADAAEPVVASAEVTIVGPHADDAWIDAAGGYLRSQDGRITLHFPAGAVSKRTHVQYAETEPPVKYEGLRYTFALDAADESGQAIHNFDAPVLLTFHYEESESEPTIYEQPGLSYWDGAKEQWVRLEVETDLEARELRVELPHFSIYSLDGITYIVERMSSIRGAQASLFTRSIAYDIGLELPPGRGGLTPMLGISYSSANHTPATGHFSVAGFGWELVGADNVYLPPGGTSTLLLNGATYTLAKTTGGQWFAEEDPFLKIQATGVGTSTPVFLIWAPDGIKYTFSGSTSNAPHYFTNCSEPPSTVAVAHVIRVPLTSIEDRSGNVIHYTWNTEGETTGESRNDHCNVTPYASATHLSGISYNGGAVQVSFSYGERADRANCFDSADWRFYTGLMLDEVRIQARENGVGELRTLRSYTLSHSPGPTFAPSQKVCNLDWIEERDPEGNPLPRTSFDYSDDRFDADTDFGAMTSLSNGYGAEVTFASSNRGGNGNHPHILSQRTESDGVASTPNATWNYSSGDWTTGSSGLASGYETVTVTLPSGAVEQHDFLINSQVSGGANIDLLAGRERELVVSAGGAELARTVTTWVSTTQSLPLTGYSSMSEASKPRFVYAEQVDTSLNGVNRLRTRYAYETYRQGSVQYGNLTQKREYLPDGAGWASEPYRTTYTAYYPNTTYWILDRPAQVDLYEACLGCSTGVPKSQTFNYYDQIASYTTSPTIGLLRKQTQGLGSDWQATKYEYWSNGNLRKVLDGNDHATEVFYDSAFQAYPVCTRNALGQETITRYYGVPGYSGEPGSGETECITTGGSLPWDGSGNVAAGRAFGLEQDATDPNGAITTTEYDGWGRMTSVWRPGESKAAGHDATLLLDYIDNTVSTPFSVHQQQREDLGGSSTEAYLESYDFYDGFGQVIQTQTEGTQGRIVAAFTGYDALGHVISQTVPYTPTATLGSYIGAWPAQALTTQTTYDGLGRTNLITNTDGSTIRMAYNAGRTAVLDELSHQTISETDGLGRIISSKQYEGTYGGPNWSATVYAQATYQYDVVDRLTSLTGPDSANTSISYDGVGRKTGMSDPDMGSWQYRYDAAGNLSKQRDARNQAICLHYDELNRPTAKSYHAGVSDLDSLNCPNSGFAVTYTYDATAGGNKGIGHRTSMAVTGGASESWVYDARGRVTSDVRTISGSSYTTGYSYDALDRARTMTYPDSAAETVTYSYDAQGMLASAVGANTYVSAATYTAWGEPLQLTYGTTGSPLRVGSFEYSTDTVRLRKIMSGPPAAPGSEMNLEYSYDDAGNVDWFTDYALQSGTPQTVDFSYDALNRLTAGSTSGSTFGSYTRSYAYTNAGNFSSFEGAGQTYREQDDAVCGNDTVAPDKPHALTEQGTDRYCYDYNGNQIKRVLGNDVWLLTYDAENRLSTVRKNDVPIASYQYDGDGVRVSSTITETTALTTIYVGKHYEKTLGSGDTKYYFFGSRLAAFRRSAGYGVNYGLRYVFSDHLGSTSVLVNGAGTLIWNERFYPYGGVRYHYDVESGSMPLQTPYRYTSQRHERAILLYDYGARYYDMRRGRFIQPDTIVPEPGNPQSLNRYTYTGGNPITYSDPTGHAHDSGGVGGDVLDWMAVLESDPSTAYHGWLHERDSAWATLLAAIDADAPVEVEQDHRTLLESKQRSLDINGYRGTESAVQRAFDSYACDVGVSMLGSVTGLSALGSAALVPSPYGINGNLDHQATVKQLESMAKSEYPPDRYETRFSQSISGWLGKDRRPDVSVVDTQTGSLVRVYEAARVDRVGNFVAREQRKMVEYWDAGIPYTFWQVGR